MGIDTLRWVSPAHMFPQRRNEEKPEWALTHYDRLISKFVQLCGNEEKPEMEVNRTSFKTNLSLDEILSKMNSGDPHDSVDENEERQFFR